MTEEDTAKAFPEHGKFLAHEKKIELIAEFMVWLGKEKFIVSCGDYSRKTLPKMGDLILQFFDIDADEFKREAEEIREIPEMPLEEDK